MGNNYPFDKKAKIGDVILFFRKGMNVKGKVKIIRNNSVIVDISEKDALELGYETNQTVVGHNNYSIIKTSVTA